MNQQELAWQYLSQKKLLHIDMLEILRRGSGELLSAGPDGVCLRDRVGGSVMVSANGSEAVAQLLACVPTEQLFVAHDEWSRVFIRENYGLEEEEICIQAAWTPPEPPKLPEFEGELRLLESSWAPYVYAHYSHAFGGTDYILGAISRGMLGLFVGETLAGFAGFHEEGAIGMLEVLPQFRRRGLGRVLEIGMLRLALERGQYAFGQIFVDNTVSLELQRSMGMTLSEERLYWIFN